MSGPGVTLSKNPAAMKSAMSCTPVMLFAHCVGGRQRMARHQIVRMRPPRQCANPREPIAHMRIIVPIDADLVIEVQIADERDVGNCQAVSDDKAAVFEMRVQHTP